MIELTANETTRKALLRKKPLDDMDIHELAGMTQNLTGGDISQTVRRASMEALRDNPQDFRLSRKHFLGVIHND